MSERKLVFLALALAAAVAAFLLWNLRAPYGFILSLRVEKLAALVLVGAATGSATIIFQTVATNRLLTPGIVGFDALYVFLQTMLVFTLGGAGYARLSGNLQFAVETLCLMTASLLLFGVLLRRGADDLVRMILTGVILGVLLRGLSGFAQRLLEPSEFAVVQQVSIASFNAVAGEQLIIAGVLLVVALGAALAMSPSLDLAALGRTKARTLGLNHDRFVLVALGIVAALVSVSTALVGPITFLGLLAASLAHAILKDHRHRILIPGAAVLGALILVLGQTVFERLLGLQSALSIVVEFAGGLLFLALVLRKRVT